MRILSFTFFLFLTFQMFGQDTTTVETITWDNNARSGTYTFPSGEESYEKILMYYNMRCKDGAVNQSGGNNVACGEWDYSCNTFLTDPTRIDSSFATHPTHLISNFSGDVFEYTTQATYTYFQFEQHEVTYSETISEIEGTVGSGTEELVLAASQNVGRAQFLYTAAELTNEGLSSGDLTGLKLDMSTIGNPVPYMRIRLKETSASVLDADNPELDGFTEVYFLNTGFDATGLHDFNFHQNFNWDGISNVIVEFTFTGSAGDNGIRSHITTETQALFNGDSDYSVRFGGAGGVDLTSDALSTIQDEITISFWSKGDENALPANTYVLEGKGVDNNRQVNVHLPWSNGRVYWDCGNDGGGYDRIDKAANVEDFAGQWNHWTFTKNAATGSMKIYLNGSLWHSGTDKNKSINLTEMYLGRGLLSSNPYFGSLDEFRLWNTELDAATIADYMRKPIDAAHPNLANLVTYLPFSEGNGFSTADLSPNNNPSDIYGGTAWETPRGIDLYKNFIPSNLRANAVFVQGEYVVEDNIIIAVDSVENTQVLITEFGVEGTDLVELDQTLVYPSGEMNIWDESGTSVGTVNVDAEGSIEVGTLNYYNKRDSKYEILSLVTPYGIGLDLGQEGKTFIFDVTDYAPILKGDRTISVELGGQNQEELDITFHFIHGTPPAEVINIQNIWPFARGWYQSILDDAVFEPREMQFAENGVGFKLRSSVTGHGQNGEFVPRTHYMNVNGGSQEYTYQVWKECGDNPIYPQGGTWIYDRAGWCPGAATDVHEFDISDQVTAGGSATIDYGLNGSFMSEANYLVSNQLVTYGAPNFSLDAAVTEIIRPSKRVEFERFNPACNNPTILIKNTGSTTLTSLKIDYMTVGSSTSESYTWTGSLAFMETEEVILPLTNANIFATSADENIFQITVSEPNGGTDEYAANNVMTSEFEVPVMLEIDGEFDFAIRLRTNNRPQENSYTVKDSEGNVVIARSNLSANTTYNDEVDLPAGCYSIELLDTNDDGLSFWADPAAGSGTFSMRRVAGPVTFALKTFEPEFGKFVKFDFIVGTITPTENPEMGYKLFSLSPNPADDKAQLELHGFDGEFNIELLDVTGKVIQSTTAILNENIHHIQSFDLSELVSGLYFVRVVGGDKVWTRQLMKG